MQNQQKEDNVIEPARNQNFEEADLDNLVIGQQILVTGAENSDGSISAHQIMIGNSGVDFKRMAGLIQLPNDNNDQVESGGEQPADMNRPNFEQMQNMSEEERIKFREEARAQRGSGGRNFPRVNMGGDITRFNGEIINMDHSTITLKIDEAGSKLIFYSDETKVLRFKTDSMELEEAAE